MFNKNVFTQTDIVADLIKGINEADYKAKMEALKGNQHKIDKNKNGKVDAHDFKILRGEKKVNEEEVEESNNPFDVKNYKSQIPTKPGEKAGFDSKKISTGTVYSRKPVKDEPMKKEEIDPNKVTTDTLAGRVKGKTANPFAPKKVMMDVSGNVNEEDLDEADKESEKDFEDRQKRLAAAGDETAKDPVRLKKMSRIPGYTAAMNLAKKTTTKEEVEMNERELSSGETAEKERIVKGMKKSLAGFKSRYGKDAKSVMYATATARAKKD
jgi:hypothetical protein